MSFQHLQQQQQPQHQIQQLQAIQPPTQQAALSSQLTTIKEVWSDNFHHEFQIIRQLLTQYNHVSFSTEFPGILARPIGIFTSTTDYHYQTLRSNCDLLNLIQLGISLSDSQGKKPDTVHSTWQFNFKFDLNNQTISSDSFETLVKTGIDFPKHSILGIDQFEFSELLTSSGLVLLPDVYWSSFHSGYDFGFLISMLTNNLIPIKEEDFLHKVNLFFPNLFDLKNISKIISKEHQTYNSLENLASDLNLPSLNLFISTGGQALLTNLCLIELKNNRLTPENFNKFNGLIHGLSQELTTNDNI